MLVDTEKSVGQDLKNMSRRETMLCHIDQVFSSHIIAKLIYLMSKRSVGHLFLIHREH